jgi:putative molybdopterin biosynthesis protein
MEKNTVKRDVYLDDKPWEEALELYLEFLDQTGALKPAPAEQIPVEKALRRVTAAPVCARVSSPHTTQQPWMVTL